MSTGYEPTDCVLVTLTDQDCNCWMEIVRARVFDYWVLELVVRDAKPIVLNACPVRLEKWEHVEKIMAGLKQESLW